jgi:hypothetical protein
MRKSLSIPTLLTVIVIAGIIALIPLSPSPLPISASSDSDDSETNTEQRLGHRNLGSGESSDFNCDENMVKSANDEIDCIPSGPAGPASPAPPPIQLFTISGEGEITITCGEGQPVAGSVLISVERQEVLLIGVVAITIPGQGIIMTVTDASTDGNTFSLSGVNGFCTTGTFTLSGDCGTDAMVNYEEPTASANIDADVECTLL